MPVHASLIALAASLSDAYFQGSITQKEAARSIGQALGNVADAEFDATCQYVFDVLAHPAGALSRFQAELRSPTLPPLLQALVAQVAHDCFANPLGKALEEAIDLSPQGFRSVVTRYPVPHELHPDIERWAQALEARDLLPAAFVERTVELIATLTYSNQAIAQAQQALVQHYQRAIDQAAGPALSPGLSLTSHQLSAPALEGLQEGVRQALEKDPSRRTPQLQMAFTAIFNGLTDIHEHHAVQSPTRHPFRPRR